MSGTAFMDRSKWEQDGDAPTCRDCKVPFGFFTRRHHCRICGKVFCNICTGRRFKGERVCNICYALATKAPDARPSVTKLARSHSTADHMHARGHSAEQQQQSLAVAAVCDGTSCPHAAALKGEIAAHKRQYEELQARLERLQGELAEAGEAGTRGMRQVQDLQRSLEQLRAEKADLEAKLAEAEARAKHFEAEVERLRRDVTTPEPYIHALEERKQAFEAQVRERYQAQIQEYERRIAEFEAAKAEREKQQKKHKDEEEEEEDGEGETSEVTLEALRQLEEEKAALEEELRKREDELATIHDQRLTKLVMLEEQTESLRSIAEAKDRATQHLQEELREAREKHAEAEKSWLAEMAVGETDALSHPFFL